jgi:hypothetical protein
MTVTTRVEEYQAGHAAGVTQCVLEGNVPTERVPEHGPPLETQILTQSVGVRREVLPCHRRNGDPNGPPIAAVVVEHQRELVGAPPECAHRPKIRAGSTVHQHQRVTLPNDVDKQGDVPERDLPWPVPRPPSPPHHPSPTARASGGGGR